MNKTNINRLSTECGIWLLGLCGLSINQNVCGQSASSAPNILVFIADDAGMDFGCYGNPNVETPYVDQLAKQGLRFDKAFLTSPQSSPSRTSMMTGMFAHTIGTEDLHSPLKAGIR